MVATVVLIACGCRYDKLVGMFSSKDVPAVGVSIGIERIFNLLEDKVMADCRDESGAVTGKIKETATQVLSRDMHLSMCQSLMLNSH